MRKALYFLGILDDSDVEWMIRHGQKMALSPGTVLRIVVTMAEPDERLATFARVMRCRPEADAFEIGAAFVDLSAGAEARLARFINSLQRKA